MDEFLMLPILDELQEENEAIEEHFRQRGDPVRELSEQEFLRLFRLTKELFQFVVEILTPFMRPPARATDLDIPTRVLAALRFYAAGSYQSDVGCNWFIGISQSSVSRSLREVTDAFNQPEILNRFVHFPGNIRELAINRRNFYETHDFPGIIGCIDCTHIAIFPPRADDPDMPEHVFINRKSYHSINVQLVCNANLKIMDVNARYPGSTHDSFIWSNSSVNQLMQDVHRAGHTDFYLLGDSGYPLRPWLLTPLAQEPPPNTPDHRYNKAHKSVRSIIERCNGLLKARFRCCLKHRVLHYAPNVAGKIINACVILHNICLEYNIPEPDPEDDVEDPENGLFGDGLEGVVEEVAREGRINADLAAGRNARARVIASRFRD